MIKDMIESLNKLAEEALEGVSEDILADVPAEEPEVAPQEIDTIPDVMTLADTLDAKTKIARALENLKIAVDEFKEATAEKVDFLKDELVLGGIVGLDEQIKAIEVALASGSNILGDSELNDAFKAELPAEPVEAVEAEPIEKAEEEAEDEEDMEEHDFDDEAGFDLINPEEV